MSTEFDDDPPTVVARDSTFMYDPASNHRIALDAWFFMPSWLRTAYLSMERMVAWVVGL